MRGFDLQSAEDVSLVADHDSFFQEATTISWSPCPSTMPFCGLTMCVVSEARAGLGSWNLATDWPTGWTSPTGASPLGHVICLTTTSFRIPSRQVKESPHCVISLFF